MLTKIKNPILFQGSMQKKNYFEGWYYKQASRDEKTIISVIPGISLFEEDPHAFLQYILVTINEDGRKTTTTGYVRYDLKSFIFSYHPFTIQIGDHSFSETGISIKLKSEGIAITGKIQLGPLLPLKTSLYMPNIMGPFAYIPKMECYHGIISMNHSLSGNLVIDGRLHDFDGGKGYIEKDWGTSFPKEYVWIHSNHFHSPNTSLFLSVARIPFMKSSFRGFICNLVVEGEEYRFATYNNSTLSIHKICQEEISLTLHSPNAKLTIEAFNHNPGELVAPVLGNMEKIIKEGLSGEVRIRLVTLKNGTTYEDFGSSAGIEVVSN